MANIVINVTQIRDNLAEIIGRVKFDKEVATVEKKGKSYAVIIGPTQYEAFQRAAKEKLFTMLNRFQHRNTQYTKDKIMKNVTELVEELRQDMYDKGK